MVYINNSFSQFEPIISGYIRNLEDTRSGCENALLPILSYFVFYSENSNGKILLPSKIFQDNKDYLNHIGEKYYNRKFDFKVDTDVNNLAFDNIAKLVRYVKKTFKYNYCDFFDFMIAYPSLFKDVNIPYKLAKSAFEETREFNHKVCPIIDNIISKNQNSFGVKISNLDNRNFFVPTYKKYLSPSQIYAFVLSNIKRALDFEILKLYDYIFESENNIIISNKLIEIESDLRHIAQGEYTKLAHGTKILPYEEGSERSENDIWIDERSSNIRRSIETQKMITIDLIEYLRSNSNKQFALFVKNGCYPEITSLLNRFFNNNIPIDLF